MSMDFEEWKESHYGKNYQNGYDEHGVCDGTCNSCLSYDYANYLDDERNKVDEELSEHSNETFNKTLEAWVNDEVDYMNSRVKVLDDFHNTVLPDWDEERVKDWMQSALNAAEVNALKDYFFELYSIAESMLYEKL